MPGADSLDTRPRTDSKKLVLSPGLALIFDLDGVIVDSMPVHQRAWRQYLESLGIEPGDLLARMHGQRNDEIVRDFLGPGVDEDTVNAHGAAKERLYRDMLRDRLREHLVPGIAELLGRIEGAPVAVATNAERPNVDFILDGGGLRSHFTAIVDGSQVALPKPAPDVYLRAAELLEIPPRNCVVFEDSPIGITAARAAGMRVVGVLTHARELEGIQFSIANFLDSALDRWLSMQRTE